MDGAGRSVVITGSSSGIGRATALLLDATGFRVFAGLRRDADADALRAEAGEALTPIRLDVTDANSIADAAEEVRTQLDGSPLYGLVNNAGVTHTAPMEFVDTDALRAQFEVNVFGVAAVTRAFLPLVRPACGRVVNVSSGSGKITTPLQGPYCASKHALEAMSDALRMELRGAGVRVSVIEPGYIETPIHGKNEKKIDAMLDALPPEGHRAYAAAIEKLRQASERFAASATPASAVAEAILHALTSRRPKIRYPVTTEARLLAWFGPFLTDRLKDAFLPRMVGL